MKKGPSGKFVLKAKDAREAGLDPELFEEFKLSLQLGNEHSERGIVSAHDMAEVTGQTGSIGALARPDNAFELHWWGTRIYVNDATTHEFIAGAQKSGAAIAAVLVAFGVTAIVAAAVGAAVFLMAGALWMICAWGGHNGVQIDRTWSGWTTVWHQ